jgi:hypothetical protein
LHDSLIEIEIAETGIAKNKNEIEDNVDTNCPN